MAKTTPEQVTVNDLIIFIDEAEDGDRNFETKVLYKYADENDSEAVSFASVKFVKTQTTDGIIRQMIFTLQ